MSKVPKKYDKPPVYLEDRWDLYLEELWWFGRSPEIFIPDELPKVKEADWKAKVVEPSHYVEGQRVTKLRRPNGSEFYVVVPFMGMEEDDRRGWPGWIIET